MSINAINQSVQQYIPSKDQVIEKFSTSLPRIVHNVSKIALPAITFFVLSNLSTAEAGPVAYGICTAYCMAFASPILLPACLIACIPVGTAPTL